MASILKSILQGKLFLSRTLCHGWGGREVQGNISSRRGVTVTGTGKGGIFEDAFSVISIVAL